MLHASANACIGEPSLLTKMEEWLIDISLCEAGGSMIGMVEDRATTRVTVCDRSNFIITSSNLLLDDSPSCTLSQLRGRPYPSTFRQFSIRSVPTFDQMRKCIAPLWRNKEYEKDI
jgi:hypothetical protein